MTDTDALVVTQEDRNRAADAMDNPFIRRGERDSHHMVQLLARHRIAAVEADRRARTFSPTEIDQAVEAELAMVVAWLRTWRGESTIVAEHMACVIECGDHRTYRSQDNAG